MPWAEDATNVLSARTWLAKKVSRTSDETTLLPEHRAACRISSHRSFCKTRFRQKWAELGVKTVLKLLPSFVFSLILLCVAANVCTVAAQSGDPSLPTPVFSNEINGTIAPLDLGDSRLTRHYYAFEATPGDLIVTVNSRNLNGDVDVFTALTFRPLTKITIYAGTIPPEVTKGIYFRARQVVILRVEARTPNDDAGMYRITLGGSFQPFSGGIPVAENAAETEPDKREDKNVQRLSSVGATIPRPPGEVAAEEPKPAETEVEKPAEEKRVTPAATARRNTTRPTPRRNPRGRTPARPTPPKTETTKTATEPPKPEEAKPPAEERKTEEKPPTDKPPQDVPAGARLIIEQTDGTRIDRPMSTVRRIIVDANVIVIVLKTGRTERIPMASVARMAIEPQ